MAKRLRKTLPKDWKHLCETASVEELKEVLSGCQVDAVDDRFSSHTAWMLSCTPMEVVEWLVRERGADINQVGGYRGTALSEGSYDRLTERIRALVALGAAATCQGEVVRVAGGISDEVCRNGGCNWSGRHRRMLGGYQRILASGVALEPQQLEEAGTICQGLPGQDSDVAGLMRLAVEWVRRNPPSRSPGPCKQGSAARSGPGWLPGLRTRPGWWAWCGPSTGAATRQEGCIA